MALPKAERPRGMPRSMRLAEMAKEGKGKRGKGGKAKAVGKKGPKHPPAGMKLNSAPFAQAKAHGTAHGSKMSDKKLSAPERKRERAAKGKK